MAELNASADPLQRYSALEQIYTEERWSAVIEQGALLLNDLPSFPGGAPEGLKERVQLLIAHAHLYGLGQRDQAEPLYLAVIHAGGEPALSQIAEESLQQCAAMAATAVPAETTVTGTAVQQAPIEEVAAPWSAAETGPQEPAAAESSETSAQAFAQTFLPMPGLESGTVAAEAAVATSETTASTRTALANPWDADPATSMAESAQQAAVDPFAAPATNADGDAPVMPWLSGEEQKTIQAQTLVIGGGANASDQSTPSHGIVTPNGSDFDDFFTSLSGDLAAAPAPIREERLIPDVIDEPELIEVHQADPRLSDEQVLTPTEDSLAGTAVATGTAVAAATATAAAGATMTARGDSARESDGIADPPGAPSSESLDAMPETVLEQTAPVQGFGVFRDPPKPVAKENPELLLALLRVQVG